MAPLSIFLLLPDAEIHHSVEEALPEAEFECVWCKSATDALIVLSHRHFDLLLSQATLPEMSGSALVDRLDAEGIDLPSLLLMGPEDTRLPPGAAGKVCDFFPLSGGFAASLPERIRNVVAKHQLEQANRLYIAALESARDGIMITDLQGTVLHVNRALESLTGFGRQDLIGRPAQVLCSSDRHADLHDRMWQAVKGRASWQGELTDIRKDGACIDVSLTVSPILDGQGRLTHCVVIERDITSRRAMQGQLLQAQKMQSLGTLAGGIAHEFNNLLTGIMGFAGLAKDEGLTSKCRTEYMQEILGLAERASELTRQMLVYARQSPANRRSFAVLALVKQTADLIGRSLRQAVTIECAPDAAGLEIDADANQLEQVLFNLILNARDALSGPGSITVRLNKEDLSASKIGFPDSVPPGGYVHIEIRDTGHGMSAEVLGRALDPFFTTRPVGKGTGMGLSVAMGILRNHHGFMTIESRVGSGTSVGVYLPRLPEPFAPSAADPLIEAEPVNPARILLHDDEGAVLEVVCRYLEDAGHHVLCARDEKEVISLASGQGNIDVAILDGLPLEADPGGLANRLRQLHPTLRLLFCPGQRVENTSLSQGADWRVLCKPFRMNELGFAIQELLAR
jgi:two-component system, cell cycle sensor histidine kinase and response regulator CckA